MDRIMDSLEGVFAYMDDSCVVSPDRQTHLHLEAFFNVLATNGLAISLEKCVFAVPSFEILGHTISATVSAPLACRAGHPRFFRAFEREAKKKAREREEKKTRKKAKALSAKEIKREFALFCLWGGSLYVCMCVGCL